MTYVPLKIGTQSIKSYTKTNKNTLSDIILLIMKTETNWNKKYELLSKICCKVKVQLWSQGSFVGIMTRLNSGWSRAQIMTDGIGFSLLQMSKPAMGPTQPPNQWVPGVLSQG